MTSGAPLKSPRFVLAPASRRARLAAWLHAAWPQTTQVPPMKAGTWILLALAIGFNLWTLRGEILPATYLNDSVVHVSMVDWARDRIQLGHLPLDGWFPNLGLGSAHFHHYQSLPHILTGLVAVIFGTKQTFAVVLYLLLCLWPLSVYWSARLLGWGPWPAAIAALVSPLLTSTPSYGYESGSYIWRGWGMWTQLWAMWLLPLSWALTWRAVAQRRSISLAALALSITVAFHFMTGYLAFLSVGVIVIIGLKDFRQRLLRGMLVLVAALAASAWVVVPVMIDSTWIIKDEFLVSIPFYHDSYGAPKALQWLWRGELYDGLRFPIVTILVGLGAIVCIARWRRDERARVPLALLVLGMLLFFGRPTLGPVLDLLPASEELFLHRYIIGVHMAGILLAGIGAAWIGRFAFHIASRAAVSLRPSAVMGALMVVLVVVLWPAWRERASFAAQGDTWIREQRVQDATDGEAIASLVRIGDAIGPGRFYSGLISNWGSTYEMGQVPIYRIYAPLGVDSIGNALRTGSLSTSVEPRFDEANAGQYDMFNVRYLIMPAGQQPAVPASEVARRGRHVLWSVATHGYVQFVDIVGPVVVADRADIGPKMEPFMNSDLPAGGLYRPVSFAGSSAASITADAATVPMAPAGTVSIETIDLQDGHVQATVNAVRPGAVILKASFDPRWQVTVHGVEVPPRMFSPSFVGRELAPGTHEVAFTYMPFPRYDLLIGLAVLTVLGPTVAGRMRRRRRGRHRRSGWDPVDG